MATTLPKEKSAKNAPNVEGKPSAECEHTALAGKTLAPEKMPGHWLLARMGKRVLRPGGIELTRKLLDDLQIQSNDDVVEFAPGLGVTARMTLARDPRTYTAVERDCQAAGKVQQLLTGETRKCVMGSAEKTGLQSASASVVYGEAMLSMQPATTKQRIVGEAVRLLRPGGRYGIHELCLTPDDVPQEVREDIEHELSSEIHVGVRPLTRQEWETLMSQAGLRITAQRTAPLHLLEPRRLISDEGLFRALRFVFNVARTPAARKRVLAMRRVFRKYGKHLTAIALIAEKPVV